MDVDDEDDPALAIAPKKKKLEDGLARRIFAEDRFRELQKQNHNELHDFEAVEARSICDDELRVLKQSLQDALQRKRDHLVKLRDAASERADALEKGESKPGDPQFLVAPVDLGATDAECRSDLRQILADTVPPPPTVDEDGTTLFKVGQTLSIFSKPRQAEFLGTLTSIDQARLTLVQEDGHELKFSLADLQSRSLVASLAGPAATPARAAN
jgi:hypothetical protein